MKTQSTRRSSVRAVSIVLMLTTQLACNTPPEVVEPASPAPAAPAPEPSASPVVEMFGRGTLSSELPEFATSLTADGQTVYFNRTSADRSSITLLRSHRVGEGWSEPERLPFSGEYFDIDPFVTADGSKLFFSSNRPVGEETEAGDFDLWVATRDAAGEWGEPEKPGATRQYRNRRLLLHCVDKRQPLLQLRAHR